MKQRPAIGVPLDSEEPGGYPPFPWYAPRQNYCGALVHEQNAPHPRRHAMAPGIPIGAADAAPLTAFYRGLTP